IYDLFNRAGKSQCPKFKIPNVNIILKKECSNSLKLVRLFVKTLPELITNIEDGKQLIKASGPEKSK
ncbi:hypothetical protein ACFL9U_15660, partial [Thermodesulfobacteriota bacterium]